MYWKPGSCAAWGNQGYRCHASFDFWCCSLYTFFIIIFVSYNLLTFTFVCLLAGNGAPAERERQPSQILHRLMSEAPQNLQSKKVLLCPFSSLVSCLISFNATSWLLNLACWRHYTKDPDARLRALKGNQQSKLPRSNLGEIAQVELNSVSEKTRARCTSRRSRINQLPSGMHDPRHTFTKEEKEE